MSNIFPPFRKPRVTPNFTNEDVANEDDAMPRRRNNGLALTQRWMLVAALAAICLLAVAGCRPNLGASTKGWGAVAVANGVVYATTLDGQVLALDDFGDGTVSTRWRSSIGGEDGFLGVYNPPAIGQHLYVAGIDGILYALDLNASGGVVGTVWRNPNVEPEEIVPLVGSPGLDEAGGIVAVGSEDGGLYAFIASTGEPLRWSPFRTDEKEIWSTPLLRNGVAYFGSQNGKVYAVSLATGEVVWEYATGGAVVAKPLIHQDMLIIGSFDRQLYALGLESGDLRWQFGADNWWWATPVSSGRMILAPSMDGKVYALNSGGGLLWAYDMGAPVVADPVLLQRGLAVATVDGKLAVLRATETDHGQAQEIASLTLGDAEIKAPLIISRSRASSDSGQPDSVYVGSDDGTVRRVEVVSGINILWCYDTEENTRCN